MEFAVGIVLVMLGVANVRAFLRRASLRPAVELSDGPLVHDHVHAHGNCVHSHPHVHHSSEHVHVHDESMPVDGAKSGYGASAVRPLLVGTIHGLAGSSAVALLVLAAIRDPVWATAYLAVFGIGTIAGMMLVTASMASAFQLTDGRSSRWTGRVGLASGLVSVAFGVFMAYRIWIAGLW
jgi:high-affinity nickel-transport protein